MILGILSDTHDKLERTRIAVTMLVEAGAESLVHCGDFTGPDVVHACVESGLPFTFVYGNNDADSVPLLYEAAEETGSTCLAWGGEIELAGRRIAVTHGHTHFDLRPLLAAGPDYLLSGHSHIADDWVENGVRRINPGALHRARQYTVATLDLAHDRLTKHVVPR